MDVHPLMAHSSCWMFLKNWMFIRSSLTAYRSSLMIYGSPVLSNIVLDSSAIVLVSTQLYSIRIFMSSETHCVSFVCRVNVYVTMRLFRFVYVCRYLNAIHTGFHHLFCYLATATIGNKLRRNMLLNYEYC